MRRWALLFPAVAFFLYGVATLSDYGINWDAPIQMARGAAFAHYFTTGKTSYGITPELSSLLIRPDEFASRYYFLSGEGNAPAKLPARPLPRESFEKLQKQTGRKLSFYQDEFLNVSNLVTYGGGHPPLVDILSGFSNIVLFQTIGVLGDIESYQFVYILLAALGVYIVTRFTFDSTGSLFAGLISGASLAVFPLFIGDAHINMKDPQQAAFFAGSIWAFWHWLKEGRLRWYWLFVLFVTFALGVKWNIIFLPFILLPWIFVIRTTPNVRRWWKPGRLILLTLVAIVFSLSFLIAIWPYLWVDPPRQLLSIVTYYRKSGLSTVRIQPPGFIGPWGVNFYPLLLVLFQTPPIVLLLAGVMVVSAVAKRAKDTLATEWLILLWIAVPVARFMIPGTNFYAGLRQLMEVVPALAVAAGMGVAILLQSTSGLLRKGIVVIIIISFITLIPTFIWIHPNENTYFNIFAGGLKGAVEKNLVDWTLTYGNIYKQGVDWLNEHAEKDANVAHLNGPMFAMSPVWFRPDISISPYHFSGFGQKGEYIVSLFNPLKVPVFAKEYPERFLVPVKQVIVDGVPLLFIYKNDSYNARPMHETEIPRGQLTIRPVSSDAGDFWRIDLGMEMDVTRIRLAGVDPSCAEGISQNDFIVFLPADQVDKPIDWTKAYVINEKQVVGSDRVEYSFAGVKARVIQVYPQNNSSCFVKGRIVGISEIRR